jgi:electron transfer flavoprotein alpha subunit
MAANLVTAVSDLVQQEKYEVILMSVSTLGIGLAGPLSASLSAPVVTEVTAVEPDMVVARPVYGGKAIIRQKIEATPAILTIRRKYFEPAILEGTTASTPLSCGQEKVRLVAEKNEQAEGIPLEDAAVIVSGGRGMGDADSFNLLQTLADQLKGAVGASRGAVDEGWASPTRQIGQTGKIVAPSVYFAVGISGASQHLAGIANSKCVVAINKDEEANIFNRARFGVVCDYKKIVPILTQAIMEGK